VGVVEVIKTWGNFGSNAYYHQKNKVFKAEGTATKERGRRREKYIGKKKKSYSVDAGQMQTITTARR